MIWVLQMLQEREEEKEEEKREVGCQWESPEERREVGCQSEAAERRDAAVQVDLLNQPGCVMLQCVCVRAQQAAGGALLQHCTNSCSLPHTAQHIDPLHLDRDQNPSLQPGTTQNASLQLDAAIQEILKRAVDFTPVLPSGPPSFPPVPVHQFSTSHNPPFLPSMPLSMPTVHGHLDLQQTALLPSVPLCQQSHLLPQESTSYPQMGLQHPAPLPSMPLCHHAPSPVCPAPPGGRCVAPPPADTAAPPAGLIAPLSPRLAEEEEEEQEEEEEDHQQGSLRTDNDHCLHGNKRSRARAVKKWRKSLRGEGSAHVCDECGEGHGFESRPLDQLTKRSRQKTSCRDVCDCRAAAAATATTTAHHGQKTDCISDRTPHSQRRHTCPCCGWTGRLAEQHSDSDKDADEGQTRETCDTGGENSETAGREERRWEEEERRGGGWGVAKKRKEEEEERRKPESEAEATEQPRKRRMVGPPIRYLLESEEQQYFPTTANHIRARGPKSIRGRGSPRNNWLEKGEDRKCGEEVERGGVERGGVEGEAEREQHENNGAATAEDPVEGWWRLCQVCGLNFTSQSGLQRHLAVHSRGRWLTCDICNKRFTHVRSLHLHRQRYHGNKGGHHSVAARGNRNRGLIRCGKSGGKQEEDAKCATNARNDKEGEESRVWRDGERSREEAEGGMERRDGSLVSKEEEKEGGDKPVLPELTKADGRSTMRKCYRGPGWSWLSFWSRKKMSHETEKWRRKQGKERERRRRRRRRRKDEEIEKMQRVRVKEEEMQVEGNSTIEGGGVKRERGGEERDLRSGCLEEERKGGGGGGGNVEEQEWNPTPPGQETAGGEEEEERQNKTKMTEQPGRPRRKRVGPPIRYLLESEEKPHSLMTANHVRGGGGGKVEEERTPTQPEQRTEGGEEEEEDRQKEQDLTDRQPTEQPGRPRRTKVGPPIRYLLESEEQSHSRMTANHVRGGGGGEMEERSPTLSGQRGAGGEEEEEEEDRQKETELTEQPGRPRRKMVGPPIRYLLESEDRSHGLTTAGGPKVTRGRGRWRKILLKSEAGSGGLMDAVTIDEAELPVQTDRQPDTQTGRLCTQTYLIYTDTHTGQEVLILPCFVRLERPRC